MNDDNGSNARRDERRQARGQRASVSDVAAKPGGGNYHDFTDAPAPDTSPTR